VLVAIAKGPIATPDVRRSISRARAVSTAARDPVLYFIQRLRDEAHRFCDRLARARRRLDIREAGLQKSPALVLRKRGCSVTLERSRRSNVHPRRFDAGCGHQRRHGTSIYDYFHEAGR